MPHPILTVEFFHILAHFPFYALIYAIFLTVLAALTLYVNTLLGTIPVDVGDFMFTFLTTIVGWLVTTRPAYALTVHDLLTDQVNHLLIQLEHLVDDSPIDGATVLLALARVVIHPHGHPPALNSTPSKSRKLLELVRTFQLRAQIPLPRSLHGLCILLVIGFHGLLLPLILYEHNGYYSLIPNFILAIYTSGCLEVATTIAVPYSGVTIQNHALASDQFQLEFHRLLRVLKRAEGSCGGSGPSGGSGPIGPSKKEKEKGRKDPFNPLKNAPFYLSPLQLLLRELEALPIPVPDQLEDERETEHPCQVYFVSDGR